jgi:hypothetical protein
MPRVRMSGKPTVPYRDLVSAHHHHHPGFVRRVRREIFVVAVPVCFLLLVAVMPIDWHVISRRPYRVHVRYQAKDA